MPQKYDPGQRDWTPQEIKEYFSFNLNQKTQDPDAIYYGEIIELLNPNIERASIEVIPEHQEEKPNLTKEQLEGLRNLLQTDLSLEANRFLIKKIKPN